MVPREEAVFPGYARLHFNLEPKLFSPLVLGPEDSGVRNCRGDKEVSKGNRNHWKRICEQILLQFLLNVY